MTRQRPKPRSLVVIDPGNAYARLGLSPLVTTDRIKKDIDRKRRDLMAQRRAKGAATFGEEEAEIEKLQRIEKEIGTPKARAAYDQTHPWNELLTVQQGPRDQAFFAEDLSGMVTAWLAGALGGGALLPSPESLALWAPGGLDPALLAELSHFANAPTLSRPAAPAKGARPPELLHLESSAE